MKDGLSFFLYSRDGQTLESTNFSAGVKNYQHQWLGGPSEASWEFTGIPETGVRAWFGRNLMKQVRVYSGSAEVWRGWIWAMEAIGKGGTWQLDMSECYNRVKVARQTTTGDTDYRPKRLPNEAEAARGITDEYTLPDWMVHQTSYERYGPMEFIDSIAGTDSKMAEAYARSLISRHAEPYEINPPVFAPGLTERLVVTCVGAQALANRIYLSDGVAFFSWTDDPDSPIDEADPDDRYGQLRYYDATSPPPPHSLNLSTSTADKTREWGYAGTATSPWTITKEICRIIRVINGAWPGLLYELDIANNTRETAAGVSSLTGAWTQLLELEKVPDKNDNGYCLQVTVDGGVIYKKLKDLPVMYHAYPNERGVEFPDGRRPRWDARPGVVKTIGSFGYRRLPDSNTNYIEAETRESPGPYLPPDHTYVERVDMADGDKQASLSGRKETPAHYRRALDINYRWTTSDKGNERGSGSSGGSKDDGGDGGGWTGDESYWDDILNP